MQINIFTVTTKVTKTLDIFYSLSSFMFSFIISGFRRFKICSTMALISVEDKNEQPQKSHEQTQAVRKKSKQAEKKKLKIKIKSTDKVHVSPVNYERHDIYNLSSTLYLPYTIPTMLSAYPIYTNYAYPVIADWTPIVPIQNPVYSIQLPTLNPVQILATQVCPNLNVLPQAIPSPILPVEDIVTYCYHDPLVYCDHDLENIHENNNDLHSSEQHEGNCLANVEITTEVDSVSVFNEFDIVYDKIEKQNKEIGDPLEFYLTLPKELFPAARSLTVDPNPIIDEFCKISNVQKHVPWILDLEFGVPNLPITRTLPTYNVKLNSISCKNAPDAIHPGFESCDQNFKKVFLFYYDCVISAWYRGYIILNNDNSVENFQSWLLLPAQILGMCWS